MLSSSDLFTVDCFPLLSNIETIMYRIWNWPKLYKKIESKNLGNFSKVNEFIIYYHAILFTFIKIGKNSCYFSFNSVKDCKICAEFGYTDMKILLNFVYFCPWHPNWKLVLAAFKPTHLLKLTVKFKIFCELNLSAKTKFCFISSHLWMKFLLSMNMTFT